MPSVILLTGTIHVDSKVKGVAIKKPEIRINQYLAAIKFYLSKSYKVVFVENSNWKTKDLPFENKNFEYLTFSSKKSILGKGHGEKEIIDFALEKSVLLKTEDTFMKITGRLIIKNISNFRNLNLENRHYANLSRNLQWADTRIMLLSKKFYYDFFSPLCDKQLNEKANVFFEKILARSILISVSNGYFFNYWPTYPRYVGTNGENGRYLNRGWFHFYKYVLFLKLKKYINKQSI